MKNKSTAPENEKLLAAIIKYSDEAIYSTDNNGKVTTWNQGAEKLFGYTASEIISRNLFETIIPKEKRQEFKVLLSMIKSGKQISPFETVRIKKDGSKFHELLSASYIRNTYGEVTGVSVIARDITKQKTSQEEKDAILAELDSLIKIAPIGIGFIDSDLRYIKVNKMLALMNNKPVTAHLGKTPSDILNPRLSRVIVRKIKYVLTEKTPTSFEIKIPAKEKMKDDKYWLAICYPIRISENNYGVGTIVEDITEQKLHDKRKDDFISMASHELNTPVTTIKAFTQILEKLPPGDKKHYEFLSKISKQTNRLSKIINDLLDISKIRSGQLAIVKTGFSFDGLVQEIVSNYKLTKIKHQIILKGKTNINILADRDRISQVITNLINNAIKYSPGKKKVEIVLSRKVNKVNFSIKDYGIGIAKKNQVNIFQSLYRVFDTDSTEYPGLGIGLYISSEIIKSHKGKIKVESKKGKGSTFSFSLPIK